MCFYVFFCLIPTDISMFIIVFVCIAEWSYWGDPHGSCERGLAGCKEWPDRATGRERGDHPCEQQPWGEMAGTEPEGQQ